MVGRGWWGAFDESEGDGGEDDEGEGGRVVY